MNKNIDKNNLNDVISISKRILKLFYVLLIVIGAYVLLRIIKELGVFSILLTILKVLSPLFIGVIVAWLLNPFVKWLETKKVRRGIGTTLAYIILIGCLILLVQAIIPLLYNQTIDLVENFPNIFASLKEWFSGLFGNIDSNAINIESIEKNFLVRLDELSVNLSTSLPSFIINSATTVISSIGTFLIGLVIGFFLLLSCDNLGNVLLDIVPKKIRISTKELIKKINQSLRNYVNGALLDACVVFVISTIAFALIGLKAPVLFGLFCGLMNVIPYAGPYIGGAPAVIVAFSQGTGIGIAVLIAVIIIQMVEGNVLQTLIISKTTKLNPVTIIIGLLVFGHFFGIVGMLLSTPIIGVCKVIIKYFDDKYDLLNFN
ncbi:MAG: AI-2E family transporter [Bacilli bacterium]|nr:AI-2E family transporter [Bacilli bacterium]